MANFLRKDLPLSGLCLIIPPVFEDDRGYFMESYQKQSFHQIGIDSHFVQTNESKSKKNVLRGLHFQVKQSQAKLIRVTCGSVYDVAVDIRKSSSTFGMWHAEILSADNKHMLYLPEGFAHGFLVLEDDTIFSYQCSDFYAPDQEAGIAWDDPDLAIKWPIDQSKSPILSDKDKYYPRLKDLHVSILEQIEGEEI